jgi:PAS domain S-box-containing protein
MIDDPRRAAPESLPAAPADTPDAIRDPARLAALRRSGLLDTPPEPAFDRLTRLTATFLDVPIAVVSLVDADRQFFKSCVGLPEPWASRRETPLSHSFCQRAVVTRQPLVIADARDDPLATDNLAVADLGVAAYAGIPLITADGHVLGALCAIAGEPRVWSEQDLAILADLAAAVVTEIELRGAVATAQEREAALREQDRLTQAMLAAAPTSLYLFDLAERRNVFISPRGPNLLGLGPAEIEAMGVEFLCRAMHPDDLPRADAHFARVAAAADGEVLEFEYRMRDATGAWHWFHSRDVVFGRDADGTPRQILGVALDVTERKRAEVALREREDVLRLTLQAARAGTWAVDLDTDRDEWSDETFALLGLDPRDGEASYPRLQAVVHPDDRAWLVPKVDADIAAGREGQSEFRVVWPDGSIHWLFARGRTITDAVGRPRRVGLLLDITERKAAEERLREAEERVRATVEQAPVGIAHVAPDGRWLLVNQRLCEIVGYPREELLSLTFQAITHPDDLDADLDAAHRVLAGEIDSYEMNKRYLRKDGSAVWVNLTVSLLRDAAGTPKYFISIVEDITVRKRTETALREQEARSRFLADLRERLDKTPDPEALFDIATGALRAFLAVTIVNVHEIDVAADRVKLHTAHREHRFGPDAQTLSEAYAPETRQRLAAGRTVAIADVRSDPLTAGRAESFERRGIRAALAVPLLRDGIWVGALILGHHRPRDWPADDVALVRTVAERVWLAYENARLLRDLRVGEERLQRQAETIRRQLAEIELIYDNAPVGLAVLDTDLRYVRINERLAEINGVPEIDHIGRTIGEVIPDIAATAEPMLRTVLETGEPLLDVEIVGETAAQPGVERVWLEHWYPVHDDAGRVAGINVVVQEITERQRAEADRVAFLDAVAHDVKNPLGVAKGQAQLLRRRLRRGVDDPAKLEESLSAIETGVNEATALIEELLDAAHLRAGRPLELRPAAVDLVALVEAAVEETRRTSTRHGVRLVAEVPSVTAAVDVARLRRVLRNLLGNAVKYSPEGGKVVVRVGREEDERGEWAVLSVRDEGIGIPAADLPHLFQRFRRGGNVANIAGTGIGLAGARQIVAQHGGTISAASIEGEGSTFTVRLPLA